MRFLRGVVQLVIFVVLIFASLLFAGIIANRSPLTDPPGFGKRLSTYLNTNVAETRADSPFAELQLQRYDAPPGLLLDIARRAAQSLKWEITSVDAAKHEIQAVVTTRIWKFKDDVTIRVQAVQPGQPSGSELWVRSASRVGKGDLGANTRHIMDLTEAVRAIAPVQALVPQRTGDEGRMKSVE